VRNGRLIYRIAYHELERQHACGKYRAGAGGENDDPVAFQDAVPNLKREAEGRATRIFDHHLWIRSAKRIHDMKLWVPSGTSSLKAPRLVMPEQCKKKDDREWNSEQPKQCTSTETHVSLHVCDER
jgi:hypothetical protein